MPAQLRVRRLLFVTGKGGVGKTSAACALALHLVERGRRVLLVECSEVSSLGPTLGVAAPEYAARPVAPGLLACRITPRECLREYGLRKLRLRSVYDLVFENAFVRALVNMLPGMEEMLVVGKIGFMAQTAARAGNAAFDTVVVDSPPTSQGLGLLSFPSIMLSAVGSGLAAREIRRIHALLVDPKQTGIVVVTIPEELAVDEALELESQLTGRVHLPACAMVVNRVLPDVFSAPATRRLGSCAALLNGGPPAALGGVLASAAALHAMRKRQEAQIARLSAGSSLPVMTLPLLLPGEQEGGVARQLAPLLASELDRESM